MSSNWDENETPINTEISEAAQRRNSLVFIINNSMSYLVAPVFYIGVLHAAILSKLKFSDTVANLPLSVEMWMLPIPMFIAWLWPSVRYLRRMLVMGYALKGLAGVVVAVLAIYASPFWLMIGIMSHAAVIGATNGVINMCQWELIGRGMTPERRVWTLGITFSVGPIFAVLGSCALQLIQSASFLDLIKITPIPEPWNYVIMFGITGPAMGLSAACVFLAHVPTTQTVEPKASAVNATRGLTLYLTSPIIMIALCGFLMTSAGNTIMSNLGLFAQDAIGEPPEKYTGLQLALRFGFKSLAGVMLGWMLARFHPKLPAVTTTLLCAAGVVWALTVPGKWYLLSFGLMGAGELYYVYYLNYIVACSAPENIRQNTAYTNVILSLVSVMPLIYGGISDRYDLRASIWLALAILIVAATIQCLFLPRRTAPKGGT